MRVTLGARRSGLSRGEDGGLRAAVTEPPEKGRATDAVRRMLAKALGVAPTRLVLVRGAQSRDKLFRFD